MATTWLLLTFYRFLANMSKCYIGLTRAAREIAERFPKFAMSEEALRRRCVNKTLPCKLYPTGGVMRKVRWQVCVDDVIATLEGECRHA